MRKQKKTISFLLLAAVVSAPLSGAVKKKPKTAELDAEITRGLLTVLWREPVDIHSRNLYWGPGGKEHQPHGTLTFVKEDPKGSNPKFDVHDQDGVKWKVKLGVEAKPETVASRLVWAVGYFANEDYYRPQLRVQGMPELQSHRRRAKKFVESAGTVLEARLKREEKGEKKIGDWDWRHDPFAGTREQNGLRVLMALINNWDLKDENNAIYRLKRPGREGDELVYMVTDLGASFGSWGLGRTQEKSKSNLQEYTRLKFIKNVTPQYVDFEVPHRPALVVLVNPHEFFSRLHLEWIGRQIPREDARWMGHLLAQLTPDQIRDAFRAGGYSPSDVKGFTAVVESRIAQLNRL